MTSRDLSAAIFLIGFVALIILSLTGCGRDEEYGPTPRTFAIQHSFYDYTAFVEKNHE